MRRRSLALSCGIAALTAWAATCNAAAAETARTYHIPRQPLDQALREFALASELDLLFSPDLVSGKYSPMLDGKFTVEEGLRALLHGTGLEFSVRGTQVVISNAKGKEQSQPTSHLATTPVGRIRLAQAEEPAATEAPAVTESQPRLEEVIVTGSHIRGAQDFSAPVITFERKDIEASGYATTQQLVRSLTQSLSNVSDTTANHYNGGVEDGSGYDGAGINLRGLGSESTLVLLNGRRLAAAGNGSFVDMSLIPLSAVERIEVLTDGASAIYGSDAVGGVVNFVLRKDFEGAETSLRYGTVTEGSHDEMQATQLFGQSWDAGHALLSLEYYDRSPLHAGDRDFTPMDTSWRDLILIPEQKRWNALGVLSHRLSDDMELFGELFYGRRQSAWMRDMGAVGAPHMESDVRQYGGTAGLTVDLSNDWQARFSGLFSENDSEQTIVVPQQNSSIYYGNESRLWSLELAADGPTIAAPGGDVRVALGAQARSERFIEETSHRPGRLDREVLAAYAEVRIPWIGARNRRSGFERLELTLAGRYEHYSDFGSAFNPKAGLSWAPVAGLNVRGTWGKSFRAPLLSQMNPGSLVVLLSNLFVDTSGTTTGLLIYGTGVDLGPEKSTNWTAGFDFVPQSHDNWKFSLTYFDIEYKDRIASPTPSGYSILGVLLDPQYQSIVTRSPDLDELAPFLAHSSFFCACVGSPSPEDIVALIDQRLRNLSRVELSGIDFSAGLHWATGVGDWAIQLGGTLLTEYRQQLVSGTEWISNLNNVWSPVDLRVRGSVSWSKGPLSAVTFVNYTDDYRDRRDPAYAGEKARPTVASWTTFDLTLQYDLTAMLKSLRATHAGITVSVINVFDRDPPFVGSIIGTYYDGANATPLGRFMSAQLTTRW